MAVETAENARKKQWRIGGIFFFGFVGLLIFGFWANDPNRGQMSVMELAEKQAREVQRNFTADKRGITSEETWISKSEVELASLRDQNDGLENRIKQLEDVLEQIANKSDARYSGQTVGAGSASTPVDLNDSLPSFPQTGGSDLPPPPGLKEYTELPSDPVVPLVGGASPSGVVNQGGSLPPAPSGGEAGQQERRPVAGIHVVSFDEPVASDQIQGEGEGSKKQLHVSHALPSGTFATAVLMNGVDAPTGGQAKENPVPILMRVVDDGHLPNYFESDIESCNFTGASWGDMASERVYIRLEKLSCVLADGSLINETVRGYVAGEDGKAGLRGRVVSKQGALIARSLFAGILSGVGSGIASQYQQVSSSALGNVTSVDPDKVLENGLASGTSNAMEKIADFWIQRANEIFPVIEVDAKRIGEVVLSDEIDLNVDFVGNMRDYDDA